MRRQFIDDQVAQMSHISHRDVQQQIIHSADVKHLENFGEPANVRIKRTEFCPGMSSDTDALREYLTRHAPDKVTESMDQAIMEVGEGKDEFVSYVARRRLERTEW
jgi:hypothetical protein